MLNTTKKKNNAMKSQLLEAKQNHTFFSCRSWYVAFLKSNINETCTNTDLYLLLDFV